MRKVFTVGRSGHHYQWAKEYNSRKGRILIALREEEPTEEILRKEITDMKLLLEEFKKEWKREEEENKLIPEKEDNKWSKLAWRNKET